VTSAAGAGRILAGMPSEVCRDSLAFRKTESGKYVWLESPLCLRYFYFPLPHITLISAFVVCPAALRLRSSVFVRDRPLVFLTGSMIPQATDRWEFGCVHTTRRASTMSAKLRNARKTTSSFSKREKIRRKPLSLRNSLSISLRFL
jgi:hypothetical protein